MGGEIGEELRPTRGMPSRKSREMWEVWDERRGQRMEDEPSLICVALLVLPVPTLKYWQHVNHID